MSNKIKEARKRKLKLEKLRRKDSSKLQRMHTNQQERSKQKLEKPQEKQIFNGENIYTPTTADSKRTHFVMPGTAVQPNYNVVNPYAGSHNLQPVPVTYDPASYGVEYDSHVQIPPQRLSPGRLRRDSSRTSRRSSSKRLGNRPKDRRDSSRRTRTDSRKVLPHQMVNESESDLLGEKNRY
mmetsp:Transcript_15270/g.15147  ORF Transcript_15270/g.15147 Transcript_15270/m.15147 type:complete len:181 (-) Transcript_15270:21-563(-)